MYLPGTSAGKESACNSRDPDSIPGLGRYPGEEIGLPNPVFLGFPGGFDDKKFHLQCRRPGFNPWVRKIPWRRKWHPTPVLLPGKSHRQRSLVGYSPWGHKESDTTELLHSHFHTSPIILTI